MNPAALSEFLTLWLLVNVGAMLLLGVMSYFGSVFILDWLESLDRRLYAAEHNHTFQRDPEEFHALKVPPQA